ncbi:helix-turn-helix domain-containing protein [Sinomicrobium weinanense]|uniref:helix-turn-helix domain-containing protein n=1 Tax=Sinomicrobium weinanense TaxID=2842200 RepID=UPI001C0DD08B|nr:AraC family transcriptional regulator [Sinomicrobium weinanense]MBU3122908.1 AraC family transcriptional regulator [Sinomicrobium weinanense]
MEFYLTPNYRIKKVNDATAKILEKDAAKLIGFPFDQLLNKESRKNWKHLKRDYRHYQPFSFGTQLYFKINKWLRFTCFWYVTQLPDKTIHISTLENKPEPRTTKGYNLPLSINSVVYPEDKHLGTEEKLINDIATFIEEHMDEPLISSKALTRFFGISEKKLIHGFKRVYGKTPYTYALAKRLQRARQLLQTTNKSVEEVAHSIGYFGKSGFYTAFKKQFGITPGQVKKQN